MKKQARLQLIKRAIKDYEEGFSVNFTRENISLDEFKKLLQQNRHSAACIWNYCCNGLYDSCWREPIFEGNWGMSKERVDKYILEIFESMKKACKKDDRMFVNRTDEGIQLVIIARDLAEHKSDYLILLTDKEPEYSWDEEDEE